MGKAGKRTGEPCAVKIASTVRRGGVRKVQKQLACSLPYDDSDAENGCMQVIPGTHVSGVVEHGKAEQAGNLLSINQEVHVTPEEEATAVDLPLRAGQISIHDGTLIHGSLPNRSGRRRCGLTLRYVPTTVRQAEDNSLDGRWRPVLVRGKDEENNFGEFKTRWQ